MEDILLSLRDVDMNYAGGYVGLTGVSMQVALGAITVVVGESASGKTNLARTICGLERPSNGTITMYGQDLTTMSLQRRNFGMTFGRDSYRRKSTVRESITQPLTLRGQSIDEIDQSAQITDIAGVLDMPISSIDDTTLAKVSVARLLAPSRTLYVADNPLTILGEYRRKYLQRIRPLLEGKSVLWLTDDLAEAQMLSNQIYVMGGCSIVDTIVGNSYPRHVATALLRGGEPESAILRYKDGEWLIDTEDKFYRCAKPIDPIYQDKKITAIRLINGEIDVNNYYDASSQYNVADRGE